MCMKKYVNVIYAFNLGSNLQNPEPAVEFDTVANVKQQHEVNVGE